jgi:general secretion pathway protein G
MKNLSTLPRRTRAAGFSLAELMVVIVILGLLATIVVPNVMKYLFKSNETKVKTDISAMVNAVDSYMVENGGKAPESLDALTQPDENGNSFIKVLPQDPWKNNYVYEPPSAGQPYMIKSYGRDGQPGGQGEDADIDNVSMLKGKPQ